jgi:methionyl-tRNA formyltransferase
MSMRSDQNLVLIGLGGTTESALDALKARFNVQALVRSGDDDVVQTAQKAGILVEPDTSIRAVSALLDACQPDIVVVSSYNRILPAEMLQKRPFVNVHYAPLPRYRGRSTVNWAILNGEPETAISIHCLTEDLDAGGILAQRFVTIGPRDTVSDLYERLNALQGAMLADAVERRLNGEFGEPQDESAASYSCGRLPSDGMIDWASSTGAIDRLIRSLGGQFPYAFSFLGVQRLEIRRAKPGSNGRNYVGRIPGRVLRVDRASGEVEVLTGDGVLCLQEVGFPGAKPLAAATMITSTRMSLGLGVADLSAFLDALKHGRLDDRGDAVREKPNLVGVTMTMLPTGAQMGPLS